jgi:hypothetical protein
MVAVAANINGCLGSKGTLPTLHKFTASELLQDALSR